MRKHEFLEILTTELHRKHIPDADEIVEEYAQHFAYKQADGYGEEETAAKLGDPKTLAAQFEAAPWQGNAGKKIIIMAGLGIADFFFGAFWALLGAWEVVLGGSALAFGTLCVCLLGNFDRFAGISLPQMPYFCAILFGMAFAALTVLSAIGAIWFFAFLRQLGRSFGRFHRNTLASAAGNGALPPLPMDPQFSPRHRRVFRKLLIGAVIALAVCTVAGYILCAMTAGSLEFWHLWGWFGVGIV